VASYEQSAAARAYSRTAGGRIFVPVELRGMCRHAIESCSEGITTHPFWRPAGLGRLGLEQHITARVPIEDVTRPVSQGANWVLHACRDTEAARWMKPLDDQAARLATTAERALLRRIEGGCQRPLGALGANRGWKTRRLTAPYGPRWLQST